MLSPPFVPYLYPSFEDVRMFLVCHNVSSLPRVKAIRGPLVVFG
jgi:hypothetical protein